MKYEALHKLQDIREEIDALADKAKEIVDRHFPQKAEYAASYGIFDMTSSWNSYNQTFATLIVDLEKSIVRELDDD